MSITVTYVPQNATDVAHRHWKIHSDLTPQGSLQDQYDQACIIGQLEAAWYAFRYIPCAIQIQLNIKNTTLSFEGEVRTFTEEAQEVATVAVEEIISAASTFAKTHPQVSFVLTYRQTAGPTAEHRA